jgi:peptidoglycan/LPS O-acetylase OafA/YrhL
MGILRIILALSVMLDHSGPIFGYSIIGGKMAVQSFFIISGFYISLILNEKYILKNNSYLLYISNRFLRIYPVYYLAFFATIIFILMNSNLNLDPQLSIKGILNIIKQLTIFVTNDYIYFIKGTYDHLVVFQSWSLGIELLFYLIAPFIVRRLKTLIFFFIVGVFLRFLFAHAYQIYPAEHVNHFFPTEAVYFFAGSLSYRLYKYIKGSNIDKLIFFISLLFISLTLVYQFIPTSHFGNVIEIVYYFLLVVSMPFLLHFSDKFPLDRLSGDLAYPIYMLHILSISILLRIQTQMTDFNKLYTVIITIIVAYFVNRFISIPLEAIRQRRVRKIAVERIE